jgi:hypothetical protein
LWPAVKVLGFSAVRLSYLLQADNVSIQLLNRVTQIVDFQPSRRANALNTLVDVVGCHAQDRHDAPSS